MKIIDGDIFDSNADAIVHQVNCQGVMGAGVARQVRDKYPNVYVEYRALCDRYRNNTAALLGYVLGIEFVDPEDQTVGDSYQVYVTGTQVAMLWEQYMNRVQS